MSKMKFTKKAVPVFNNLLKTGLNVKEASQQIGVSINCIYKKLSKKYNFITVIQLKETTVKMNKKKLLLLSTIKELMDL